MMLDITRLEDLEYYFPKKIAEGSRFSNLSNIFLKRNKLLFPT